MANLQNLIHKLEVGGGPRLFRFALIALVVFAAIVLYDAGAFRNLATQEAMDAAQLGRNLAEGKGYTTLFIRPFSMYLLKSHSLENRTALPLGNKPDDARLGGNHPDLANPPLYPLALAGLMKVLHFRYGTDSTRPFWSIAGTGAGGRMFWRYQPDFLITLFNQALFLLTVALVFLLAWRLVDKRTAWLSTTLLLGTELCWRFTVSGLSTMLALLIFMGLVWAVVLLEGELREPRWSRAQLFVWAVLIGLLVGLGALTRYSLGWLIVPVVVFLLLFAGRQRFILAGLAFAGFALLLAPWVARNFHVSGTPFGTAGYAVVEATSAFPGHQLERSLQPEIDRAGFQAIRQKLVANLRTFTADEMPRLGGTWLTAFFLVGLLANFGSPGARRLRHFLLLCLGMLVLVQALGRTQLSEDSPTVNSENLLVLTTPLVILYGVSFFYLLLDQLEFRFRELRYAVIGLLLGVACLPLLLVLAPLALNMLLHFQIPRGDPLVYPPYYPPYLEGALRWNKTNELVMTDVPWAVAWSGRSPAVWLTLRVGPDIRELKARNNEKPLAEEDFFAINDFDKPIYALFLTRSSLDKLDSRSLTPFYLLGEQTWGSLITQVLMFYPRDAKNPRPWPANTSVPALPASGAATTFPLHFWQSGWPEYLLLTSRQFPVGDK